MANPPEWRVQVDSKPFEWRVQMRDRIKVGPNIAARHKDVISEKGQTMQNAGAEFETSKVMHAHMIPRSYTVENLHELCMNIDENASHNETLSRGNLRLLQSPQDDTKPKTRGRPVYYLTVGALTSFKIRLRNNNGSGEYNKVFFSLHFLRIHPSFC